MVVTRYLFVYKLAKDRYLLINSLTGAVDVVETEVLQAFAAIRRGTAAVLADDEIRSLVARGHLYPSRADEEAVVDRLVAFSEENRARTQAICFVLCPTVSCNLRCPYCFEPHKMHEDGRLMTPEQVEQAFVAVDEIRRMRPEIPQASLNLFGGEPLLPSTRHVVANILERAAARDLPISITSNGTHAHVFSDLLRPYRDRILFDISMDGPQEIHDRRRITVNGSGTFSRISANVSLLLSLGFRVAVRMNLNEDNVAAVPAFLEHVRQQGWNRHENFQMTVSPVTNYTGRSAQGLIPPSQLEVRLRRSIPDHLLKEIPVSLNGDVSRLNLPVSEALGESMVSGKFMPSLYYCEASGALFYCMGPDSFIYPCNQIIGDPTWAIGSFFPSLSIDPEKAGMWQDRAVTNMPGCMECGVAFLCSGGCPVLARRTTGSPMDSYCGTAKQELAAYVRSVAPQLLAADAGASTGHVRSEGDR
jgi:uncharacterized protein